MRALFSKDHPMQSMISLLVALVPQNEHLIDLVSHAIIAEELVPMPGSNPRKEEESDPIIEIVLGPNADYSDKEEGCDFKEFSV